MVNDPLESDKCKAFVRQVKQLRCWNQFSNDFELVHNCNESPQGWGMNRIQARNWNIKQWEMGKLSGMADYTIYYNKAGEDFCRAAVIEYKRNESEKALLDKGKKPEQEAFRRRALELKMPYLLTCYEEEAIEYMKDLLK